MNYMSEVAKMLGVELGEEFEIVFPNNLNCHATAILNHERLYIKDHNLANQDMWQQSALTNILNGNYTVNKKPWKPEDGDTLYYVDWCGSVVVFDTHNCDPDEYINYYKIGNCYRTKKEAEANCDKWKAFYESDEVLEV